MSSNKDPVNLEGTVGHVRKSLDASCPGSGLPWNVEMAAKLFSVPPLKEDERTIYFV